MRLLFTLGCLVSLAGCHTTSVAKPTPNRSLGDAITHLQERTYREYALEMKPQEPLPTVDFRSVVEIDFDKEALRKIATGEGLIDILPPESPDVRSMRERNNALFDSLKDFLKDSKQLEARAQALRQGAEVDLDELEAALRRRDQKIVEIVKAAREAVLSEARANGWSDLKDESRGEYFDPRTDQLVRSTGEKLFPAREPLNVAELTRILNKQLVLLQEAARHDVAAAEAAGTVGLRVRAYLVPSYGGGKRTRLHVRNYDNLESGGGVIKRAVSFELTEGDQRELERRLEVTKDFANLINDLRDKNSELRRDLGDLRDRIEADLREFEMLLVEVLPAELTEAVLESAKDLLDEIQESSTSAEKAREIVKSYKELFDEARALRERVENVKAGSIVDVLKIGQDAANFASDSIELIKNLPRQVEELIESLSEIKEIVSRRAQDFTAAQKTKAQAILGAIGSRGEERWDQFKEGLGRYPQVLESIATIAQLLRNKSTQEQLGGGLFPIGNDDSSIIRSLDKVQPAFLNLADTPAKAKDRVIVFAELVRSKGGDLEPISAFQQEYDVVARGLYNTWDSHLIFVDRLHNDGTTGNQSFEAAPSATWTLHYRKIEESESKELADSWAGLWNTVDPGVGINVAALNFDEGDVEIGVAVHATLFQDLLQVGYGRNLNVSDDEDYFFIGISLFETFNLARMGLGGISDE